MPLYFRQFHQDREDPALDALSDAQFRIYWRLMCFANEQPERGVISDVPTPRLAVAVAKSNTALLTKTLPVLTGLGLITLLPGADEAPATLVITNWQDRQNVPPSARPENIKTRVARWRTAHRGEPRVTPARYDVTDPRYPVTDPGYGNGYSNEFPQKSRYSNGYSNENVLPGNAQPLPGNVPPLHGNVSPLPRGAAGQPGPDAGDVTESRDNVTGIRYKTGTPYITHADDAPTRARAEYNTHAVDQDEPEDPEASMSLPESRIPKPEIRARALDHPTATGADDLYTGPPVTETGLTWWTHYLAVEGVDAPPAWTTIAWLQAQQEAMACKAQLDQRRIRNWALEMQRWLRNELQIRVRDGTVHKAEPAPGPARPANIPPPATGAGLIPPALSESPDAAAARARLAEEQLRAWVLNLGRQLHDPAGVAAAQTALLAHLAAHPTLHVLSVKSQLVGLVEATNPQTLAELWGFARIPLAPPTAPGDEKEILTDDPSTLAAAPLRP